MDGEHYPPVTRWAIEVARRRGYDVVAALLVGGTEKLRAGETPEFGVPARLAGSDRMSALREAIDLILEAGGVAVIAHPGLTRRDELIEYLVRLGVRGLEVYHPKHDFVDISRYLKMCAKFDLFATGGSDFHGIGKADQPPGSVSTPADQFHKMMKYIAI